MRGTKLLYTAYNGGNLFSGWVGYNGSIIMSATYVLKTGLIDRKSMGFSLGNK